jgi:hypothetical protein
MIQLLVMMRGEFPPELLLKIYLMIGLAQFVALVKMTLSRPENYSGLVLTLIVLKR